RGKRTAKISEIRPSALADGAALTASSASPPNKSISRTGAAAPLKQTPAAAFYAWRYWKPWLNSSATFGVYKNPRAAACAKSFRGRAAVFYRSLAKGAPDEEGGHRHLDSLGYSFRLGAVQRRAAVRGHVAVQFPAPGFER